MMDWSDRAKVSASYPESLMAPQLMHLQPDIVLDRLFLKGPPEPGRIITQISPVNAVVPSLVLVMLAWPMRVVPQRSSPIGGILCVSLLLCIDSILIIHHITMSGS